MPGGRKLSLMLSFETFEILRGGFPVDVAERAGTPKRPPSASEVARWVLACVAARDGREATLEEAAAAASMPLATWAAAMLEAYAEDANREFARDVLAARRLR